MITVYAFSTPNSVKIPIMLEELGVPYDLRPVNIRAGEQKAPSFLALNPNGKVPVLVDDDLVIAESGAILIYLAEKHGQFLASDATTRARTFEWLMVQMSGTGPAFGQSGFWQKLATERNEAAITRYSGEANRLADLVDAHLGRQQWFAGDQYSIADIAHFGWFWRREFAGVSIDARPNLARWYAAIEQRPGVQRAVQRTMALAMPNAA